MSTLRSFYNWVPSVYVVQGLPYALVNIVAPIFYKGFDVSNISIAFYTSLLALPWLCKPALAPILEGLTSKRLLTLTMQFSLVGALLVLALSLTLTNFLLLSGILFFIIALISAVHDMSSDGLYIVTLPAAAQAHFIGIRTFCYQLGMLVCKGGLVFLAGYLLSYVSQHQAWQFSLLLLAAIVFILAIYHQKFLPKSEKNITANLAVSTNALHPFKSVFAELLNLPHLTAIIIFALIYNFAEGQLAKIVPLFLLDKISHGGLALSVAEVGTLFGGVGTLGMLAGVLLSGFILTKFSLKRCLIPLTITAGLTNITYLLLIFTAVHANLWIGLAILLAQFGFGLSNGAYMLYLLTMFTRGQFPMSLYAIGTALMGFSMFFSGAISGYLQSLLGYQGFFIWILIASFGIILLAIYTSRKVLA